jgi:hypothetical protein
MELPPEAILLVYLRGSSVSDKNNPRGFQTGVRVGVGSGAELDSEGRGGDGNGYGGKAVRSNDLQRVATGKLPNSSAPLSEGTGEGAEDVGEGAIFPADFQPFLRKPLLLIVDCTAEWDATVLQTMHARAPVVQLVAMPLVPAIFSTAACGGSLFAYVSRSMLDPVLCTQFRAHAMSVSSVTVRECGV